LACYIPRWYTRPKTVTHPGTNRARRALTSFMRRTPLTSTPCRQPILYAAGCRHIKRRLLSTGQTNYAGSVKNTRYVTEKFASKNPMNPWMMDALLYYLCDRPLKIVWSTALKVLIRPGSFLSFVYFPCPASADFFVLFRAGVGEVHGNTAEKFEGT